MDCSPIHVPKLHTMKKLPLHSFRSHSSHVEVWRTTRLCLGHKGQIALLVDFLWCRRLRTVGLKQLRHFQACVLPSCRYIQSQAYYDIYHFCPEVYWCPVWCRGYVVYTTQKEWCVWFWWSYCRWHALFRRVEKSIWCTLVDVSGVVPILAELFVSDT